MLINNKKRGGPEHVNSGNLWLIRLCRWQTGSEIIPVKPDLDNASVGTKDIIEDPLRLAVTLRVF